MLVECHGNNKKEAGGGMGQAYSEAGTRPETRPWSLVADQDPGFSAFRYKANLRFATIVAAAACLLVLGLWLWDYAVDPAHYQNTPLIRVYQFLTLCLLAVWLHLRGPVQWLPWVMLGVLLVVETFYVYVLGMLDKGPEYGVGGILYFFIYMPLFGLVLSFRWNVLLLFMVALYPLLLGLFGWADYFPLGVYAVYAGSAFVSVLIVVYAIHRLLWEVYCSREYLKSLASTDELTGIHNRRAIMQLAQKIMTSGRSGDFPLSIAMVDLDHFKQVNDRYGHQVGDQVLNHVIGLIRNDLRHGDFIGRYGGEEFLLLLPATDMRNAQRVAERLRHIIESSPATIAINDNEVEIVVTVSMGLCALSRDQARDMPLEHWLELADANLYRAKQEGRNRVCTVSIEESAG